MQCYTRGMFPANNPFPKYFCINTNFRNKINVSVPLFSIRSHKLVV